MIVVVVMVLFQCERFIQLVSDGREIAPPAGICVIEPFRQGHSVKRRVVLPQQCARVIPKPEAFSAGRGPHDFSMVCTRLSAVGKVADQSTRHKLKVQAQPTVASLSSTLMNQ